MSTEIEFLKTDLKGTYMNVSRFTKRLLGKSKEFQIFQTENVPILIHFW